MSLQESWPAAAVPEPSDGCERATRSTPAPIPGSECASAAGGRPACAAHGPARTARPAPGCGTGGGPAPSAAGPEWRCSADAAPAVKQLDSVSGDESCFWTLQFLTANPCPIPKTGSVQSRGPGCNSPPRAAAATLGYTARCMLMHAKCGDLRGRCRRSGLTASPPPCPARCTRQQPAAGAACAAG